MNRHMKCQNSVRWIVILLMIFCKVTVGQNSAINFDAGFHVIGSKTIDPNELVQLTGARGADVLKLKVFTSTPGSVRQEAKNVQINDKGWSVIVGPFLAKQKILLEFDVVKKMDSKKSDSIKRMALELAKDAFFQLTSRLPEDAKESDFVYALQQSLDTLLSPVLKDFKDENGVSLKESLLKFVTTKGITDLLGFLNKELNVLDAKNKSFNRALDTLIKRTLSDQDLVILNNIRKLKVPAIKDSSIQLLSGITDTQKNKLILLVNSIKLKTEAIGSIINNELQKSVLASNEVICINDLQSDLLNTDIKNYIGIDIMPTLYDVRRPGTFGLFLTFNPYFGKINPEEQLIEKANYRGDDHRARGSRFINSFKRIVTPTVGLGLLNNPTDSTLNKFMVFVGVSMRMNKLVRFSVGKTFYSAKLTPKTLLTTWTYGISLDIEYLADVLKIVSSTTKQFYQ